MTERFAVMHVPDAAKRFTAPEIESFTGDEYGWVVVDNEKNEIVGCDGGEPEDQTLARDWDWVVPLLNKVVQQTREETKLDDTDYCIAIKERDDAWDRAELAEAKLEIALKRNVHLGKACDLFERNSEKCVDEYEGRLKAEAQVAELTKEAEFMRSDFADYHNRDREMLAEAEKDKERITELTEALQEFR